MTMNDPLLRTDSYAKIFLYNTHETVACVPRHTIRMRDKVRPDKLREAVEQALLRFPHMMLTAEPTETAFRYRRNVQPAVVLPFDGVSTPLHHRLQGYERILISRRLPRQDHLYGVSALYLGWTRIRGVYPLCTVPVPEKLRFPG